MSKKKKKQGLEITERARNTIYIISRELHYILSKYEGAQNKLKDFQYISVEKAEYNALILAGVSLYMHILELTKINFIADEVYTNEFLDTDIDSTCTEMSKEKYSLPDKPYKKDRDMYKSRGILSASINGREYNEKDVRPSLICGLIYTISECSQNETYSFKCIEDNPIGKINEIIQRRNDVTHHTEVYVLTIENLINTFSKYRDDFAYILYSLCNKYDTYSIAEDENNQKLGNEPQELSYNFDDWKDLLQECTKILKKLINTDTYIEHLRD